MPDLTRLFRAQVVTEHSKKKDSFCIALYCEDTDQPCILIFPEFDGIAVEAGRAGL